jgi:nucleoside-diphosphate-sugar epimerase
MKAFLTGGAGFLGRQVVQRLLADGHHVVCMLRARSNADNLRADAAKPGVRGTLEIIRGHIGRPDTYRDALAGSDVVYHIAAEMKGATAVLFLTNVVGTRALIAASQQAKVKRFVLVSSLGVYSATGVPSGGTLDENVPLDPKPHLRDPYSYSKIAEEKVAWEAHRTQGLPLVVIRPGVIYGPGRDWITGRTGLRMDTVLLKMGGHQVVPYTYVDNCADAVYLAGTAAGVEGQVFNIIDDNPPTVNALVRLYKREIGTLHVVPIPRVAIGTVSGMFEWYNRYSNGQLPAVLSRYKSQAMWKRQRFANEKAKRGLGWTPATSFDEGLARTADSLRTPARSRA